MGLDTRDNEFMFSHKVGVPLFKATGCFSEQRELTLDDKILLGFCKITFRNYFEMCFDPALDLELPTTVSLKVAQEAYRRSDFDWSDKKLYYEFCDWVRENLLRS